MLFHREMCELIYDADEKKIVVKGFRGCGKSSILEEFGVVSSCRKQYRNILIVGSSFDRAVERLKSIKHEIDSSENVHAILGDMRGDTWQEGRVVLSNDVMVQCCGRGQALRGIKHYDNRPDLCLVDDFEDEESVRTKEAQDKTMRWFMGVLLPALDPNAKIVVFGTPLDANCVLEQLMNDRSWTSRSYPIEYVDEEGNRQASWPGRFSLEWIDERKELHRRMGMLVEFEQEYMCKAVEESQRIFKNRNRVETVNYMWAPRYVLIDPARTTQKKSSQTGVCVWSWIGRKLVVWEAYGLHIMPDEIVNLVFQLNNDHMPVAIAVEEDGLAEFLLQPLRAEIARRGVHVPLMPVLAPRDRTKLDFIKGLQPYDAASEILFAKPLPELESQMMNYPTGKLDVINALAYALKIHRGKAVYEDFSERNVIERMTPQSGNPCYLGIHSDKSTLAGVLMSYDGKRIKIYEDFAFEGDPALMMENLIRASGAKSRSTTIVLHPEHYKNYSTTGIRGSLSNMEYQKGSGPEEGRKLLSDMLRASGGVIADVLVSTRAKRVLQALSGGFAREINTDGSIAAEPMRNTSRLIMECVETFLGNSAVFMESLQMEQTGLNYSVSRNGRTYLSTIPHAQSHPRP